MFERIWLSEIVGPERGEGRGSDIEEVRGYDRRYMIGSTTRDQTGCERIQK